MPDDPDWDDLVPASFGVRRSNVACGPEAAVRGPRCPTCGRAVEWQENRVRPFCSVTCTLVDLGAWLDGRYAIPGEAAATDPGPPPADPSANPPAASQGPASDPPPRRA